MEMIAVGSFTELKIKDNKIIIEEKKEELTNLHLKGGNSN